MLAFCVASAMGAEVRTFPIGDDSPTSLIVFRDSSGESGWGLMD